MRLIFPLKWLHTYIPLLPDSQIEYLEAPTPYIMGILSSAMSFEALKENFPDHEICNVDTSEIHAENVVKLPQVEETKLRKKLQFVKNPEIFDIEEIITEPQNKIMIEDVMPDRSFSDNVQHIFFHQEMLMFLNLISYHPQILLHKFYHRSIKISHYHVYINLICIQVNFGFENLTRINFVQVCFFNFLKY